MNETETKEIYTLYINDDMKSYGRKIGIKRRKRRERIRKKEGRRCGMEEGRKG